MGTEAQIFSSAAKKNNKKQHSEDSMARQSICCDVMNLYVAYM